MAYKEVSVKQPLLLTILPYVSIIIFFAFWEGVVRSGIIPNTLLASPSQVFAAFIDKLSNPNPDGAIMATHAWTSIQEAFIGYVLSLVVGIPLGLAMGWFNVVEGLFRPISPELGLWVCHIHILVCLVGKTVQAAPQVGHISLPHPP